jgi:hypothetical protein
MFYSSAQDYKIKFSQTLLILVNSEEAAPEGPNLNLKTFWEPEGFRLWSIENLKGSDCEASDSEPEGILFDKSNVV